MKVRIQNDGGPGYTTLITEAETGKTLDLQLTEVHITVKDMPRVLLTSAMPVIDIIADAEIKHVCPCCGREVWPDADANRPATTEEAASSAGSSARLD